MEFYDWDQVHSQILRETFDSLDLDRATALVGVLSTFRISFSQELRTVVEPVEEVPPEARVLTPEQAARLVGDHFGWDAADLLRKWRWRWVRLKSSDLVDGLLADLKAHRFVGRISPLPVV